MSDKDILRNCVILITGGTGSWAYEMVRQLLEKHAPKEIRIYSRNELHQVEMKRYFQSTRLKFIIGDVRDKARLMMACENVDYILHTAALKHVPVCEENPSEAIKTNIIGTENVIEAAVEHGVKKALYINTDKAVDPLNLYGLTKACGEKLFIVANTISSYTKFACVRAGNVLGTNGSVVPLFRQQLERLNEVTITERNMTRFFLKVETAVEMALDVLQSFFGGEIFVTKMPACKILDLAYVMINHFGNEKSKIVYIGMRPGEKIHEVLVSKYETPRTYAYSKYYVIMPHINLPGTRKHYEALKLKKINKEEYNSKNFGFLSRKQIYDLLESDGWFTKEPATRYETDLKKLDKRVLKDYFRSEGWVK